MLALSCLSPRATVVVTVCMGLFLAGLASAQVRPRLTTFIQVQLISMDKVNGVEQSFVSDFFFQTFTQHPELLEFVKTNGIAQGQNMNVDAAALSFKPNSLEFINANDYTAKYSQLIVWNGHPPNLKFVQPTDSAAIPNATMPWLQLDGRYAGTFRADLNLVDFPFDGQTCRIAIESETFDETEAQLIVNPTSQFSRNMAGLVEWNVVGAYASSERTYYSVFDANFSRGTFALRLERLPDFYINKIVVGMVLLVIMSLSLYLMDPDSGDRSGNAATFFLGIITYLFIVSSDVPKVAYQTKLDRFIFMSMMITFVNFCLQMLIFFMAAWSSRVVEAVEKEELRQREESAIKASLAGRRASAAAAAAARRPSAIARGGAPNGNPFASTTPSNDAKAGKTTTTTTEEIEDLENVGPGSPAAQRQAWGGGDATGADVAVEPLDEEADGVDEISQMLVRTVNQARLRTATLYIDHRNVLDAVCSLTLLITFVVSAWSTLRK